MIIPLKFPLYLAKEKLEKDMAYHGRFMNDTRLSLSARLQHALMYESASKELSEISNQLKRVLHG